VAEAVGTPGRGDAGRGLAFGLALALAATGLLALAAALWMTPELALRRAAFDELTPDRALRLAWLRGISGLLGLGLVALSLRARWLLAWLPRASARTHLPLGTLAGLLGAFGALFLLNFALRGAGLVRATARLFPISIVRGPELHAPGLPAAALFALVLWAALRARARIGAGRAFACGLALLVLGNLAQGGFEAGFVLPFTDPRGGPPPGIQYYHDALEVGDARAWLTGFNAAQPSLRNHARTHPPFAVLVHRALLGPEGSPLLLAVAFPLVAGLAVPLLWHVARLAGAGRETASLLALGLAALPAFNVYAASSLDGLVLAATTLALWGWLAVRRGAVLRGTAAFAAGLAVANLLSFGASFAILAAALLALHEAWTERRLRGALVWLSGLTALAAVCAGLRAGFGYDHLEAFATASRLENPHGFRGFAAPLDYLLTRIECVAEIAVFFSLPALAVWVRERLSRRPAFDLRREGDCVEAAGLLALAAVFATGAFWTGETARACLFIQPWLMLGLRDAPPRTLAAVVTAGGAQTIAMQLFANFFW
jgi:hypothetical protein